MTESLKRGAVKRGNLVHAVFSIQEEAAFMCANEQCWQASPALPGCQWAEIGVWKDAAL